MNVQEFYALLRKKILFLDGATGTELQKHGLPQGVCPEKWVIDNPESLISIQRKYRHAGSDAVMSCTFGANYLKLKEFGLSDKVYEFNKHLVEISRRAVGTDGLIGGDIGPTGLFVEPFGELAFEDAVNIFKEQVKAQIAGGVDFFMIETIFDIQEARAAVIAIKETCDLPIVASMTFSADGYTLNGTDPLTAFITLRNLGIHVFGINCSVGPDILLKHMIKLKEYSDIPLSAKPNAGLPQLINGKTVFSMKAEEFAEYSVAFADVGVNLFGGCCGTSYDCIARTKERIGSCTPKMPLSKKVSCLSSSRMCVFPAIGTAVTLIGERINPTGKKKLQEELKEGTFYEVKKFAVEQENAQASVLDVNVGMPGIDEKAAMVAAVKVLSTTSKLPLCIDSAKIEVIEAALRMYPGRALINSISGEKVKIEKLLPLAAKYGAMFILLPLNDTTVPKTAQERIVIIEEVLREAGLHGFTREDIVVDGLTMTVSADSQAAKETLQLLTYCSTVLKINTVLGLSNVSFGLPNRKSINATFLAMAIAHGLSMAIANPCEEILLSTKLASDVLLGTDANSKKFIEYSTQLQQKETNSPVGTTKTSGRTIEEEIFHAVLEGNKEKIAEFIEKSLVVNKIHPGVIVDECLIKAINKVGEQYEKKIYFLPQLIASAEAMKAAFHYLEPKLRDTNKTADEKVKVLLATVKGDIHDIGKNIVGLMLKNYGFSVIDLGKDVPCATIISEAIKHNADVIGLSALMTTTMGEMKVVVDELKKRSLACKVIIGGAVVTQDYALSIGAHGYAKDGVDAVKVVQELTKTRSME